MTLPTKIGSFAGECRSLEIIYERFIRQFRISLVKFSKKNFHHLGSFNRPSQSLGSSSTLCPSHLACASSDSMNLRGHALLVFESKLAYAIIDSYFGGVDRPFTKIEGKEFTQIELSFMRKVMNMAIADLEEAWAPIHRIDAQYLRTEINPQFVGVVPPSDAIIATTMEVEFESASGSIIVVYPYSTIEPIKQKLSSNFQTDNDMADSIWTQSMNGHVMNVATTLAVKLGEAEITAGELITLEEGRHCST